MITEGSFSRAHTAVSSAPDRIVVELVDAMAEAVDLARWAAVDRLAAALAPFDLAGPFRDELRLSGVMSLSDDGYVCGGECYWDDDLAVIEVGEWLPGVEVAY